MKDMRLIKPYDHGYRVALRRSSGRHGRCFPFRKHGSPAAALKAAQQFRDEAEKLAPKQKAKGGMHLTTFAGRWVVSPNIHINGKRYSTCFAVDKHGIEGARRLARQWLEERRQ